MKMRSHYLKGDDIDIRNRKNIGCNQVHGKSKIFIVFEKDKRTVARGA